MPPAVSVICTFLNAEDTLEATLESLRLQTTTRACFVLVDDGSTDRSAAIAERFVACDSRFVLHRNPSPGRVRALKLAVAATDSEYVAVLDADDLAHPAWLADALTTMQAKPEFAVVGFERLIIRGLEQPEWAGKKLSGGVRNVTRRLARGNLIGHSGAVIHKPRLLSVGGYDVQLAILEDYDLWIRLAEAGHSLGISELVRIAKRYHEGQKFSRSRGFLFAAWRAQLRAIMVTDRNYRNFLRLGLRVAGDITRRPRRALASGMRRR